jgi:hypothetical protein
MVLYHVFTSFAPAKVITEGKFPAKMILLELMATADGAPNRSRHLELYTDVFNECKSENRSKNVHEWHGAILGSYIDQILETISKGKKPICSDIFGFNGPGSIRRTKCPQLFLIPSGFTSRVTVCPASPKPVWNSFAIAYTI